MYADTFLDALESLQVSPVTVLVSESESQRCYLHLWCRFFVFFASGALRPNLLFYQWCRKCQHEPYFLTSFVIGFPYTMFLFKRDLPQDVCISRDWLHIAWGTPPPMLGVSTIATFPVFLLPVHIWTINSSTFVENLRSMQCNCTPRVTPLGLDIGQCSIWNLIKYKIFVYQWIMIIFK